LGGGVAVGGVCLRHQVRVSLHLLILEYQVRVSLHLLLLEYSGRVFPHLQSFLAGASTVPEAEDAISLYEGGGSFYESILREVWINGYAINLYVSFIMEEKELKWPPTFQEVFDKAHKEKGTDQYISDNLRGCGVV
ncbi:hypothetical protein Taro_044390, partial [Colocasia esculenta]|nr:hypothetical protein [Colocasia esculenta]